MICIVTFYHRIQVLSTCRGFLYGPKYSPLQDISSHTVAVSGSCVKPQKRGIMNICPELLLSFAVHKGPCSQPVTAEASGFSKFNLFSSRLHVCNAFRGRHDQPVKIFAISLYIMKTIRTIKRAKPMICT